MRVLIACAATAAVGLCTVLTGCYGSSPKQNPDQVREKTAEATAALKQNARAMAQGIREGWKRDHPLDLNSATSTQLASLPGIDAELADKIVANRPYQSPQDLVQRRILSRQAYARIADRVTAKK
jgi:hypothetical protein